MDSKVDWVKSQMGSKVENLQNPNTILLFILYFIEQWNTIVCLLYSPMYGQLSKNLKW